MRRRNRGATLRFILRRPRLNGLGYRSVGFVPRETRIGGDECMRFVMGMMALALLTAAAPVEPPMVRVRLETSAGPIVIALDTRHAPKTTANFLAYVDDQRLDGTAFFRASRRPGKPGLGFI